METIQDRATRLGMPVPLYAREANPGLHQAWEDRVQQVESLRARGRDTAAAERDALAYTGRPVPTPRPFAAPVAPPVPVTGSITSARGSLESIVDALDDDDPAALPSP